MEILLLFHIVISAFCIYMAGYVFIKPALNKFYYGLVLTMLSVGSGVLLEVLTPTNSVSASIEGVLYTGVVLVLLAGAKVKITKAARPNISVTPTGVEPVLLG